MKSLELWFAIALIVLGSSGGDVLLSAAMKRIGDLHHLRASHGLLRVIGRIFTEKLFLLALCSFSVGFFSLLTALSWGDLSLVAPASASLTFVASAIMAKVFLKEAVDHRRWISAILVCIGVALLR
ncbi:MAG TPA: EamA family transporter [Candidatus Angelobacter sp.]|nr:EamA family transporter [Candidatus Angelobacter sp.]